MFPKHGKPKKGGKLEAQTKPPATSAYKAKRNEMAERSADQSKIGRDIGDIPPVVNQKQKDACANDLGLFLKSYFPETFRLPWSKDHLDVIDLIQKTVRDGGQYACSMPRGNGKTALMTRAVLWAVFYGYRRYIALISSDEGLAGRIASTLQLILETNDRLNSDFPEVCYPIRKLDRIANRCKGQLHNGVPTYITWTADMLVLPSVDASKASGVIVEIRGMTGGIRGMTFTRPSDGQTVRPDLVLIDEPQTRASARSPSQCAERIEIIQNCILNLAGPTDTIAALLACTVIAPDDAADQLLDRKLYPAWHGKRTKFMYGLPTNEEKWERYRELRGEEMRNDRQPTGSNEFYSNNRAEMDAGGIEAWPQRYLADELSATQHAMNIRFFRGESVFAAEYQGEPLRAKVQETELPSLEALGVKLNNRPRGIVPDEATKLVAFIDVQKNALPWMVCAFDQQFNGWIVDYGFFPEQNKPYFSLASIKKTLQKVLGTPPGEATIYAGLKSLTNDLFSRPWKRENGEPTQIDRCGIDVAWGESADVIFQFIKESPDLITRLTPMLGKYYGAKTTPMSEYRLRKGDEVGDHWRRAGGKRKRDIRHTLVDANFWKSFAFQRLAVPLGGAGCLSVFGKDASHHQMLFDQLRAERPRLETSSSGRTVTEWELPPSKPDNHYLDTLSNCHVLASMLGSSLAERQKTTRARRERVSFKMMRAEARKQQEPQPASDQKDKRVSFAAMRKAALKNH